MTDVFGRSTEPAYAETGPILPGISFPRTVKGLKDHSLAFERCCFFHPLGLRYSGMFGVVSVTQLLIKVSLFLSRKVMVQMKEFFEIYL